MATSPIRTYSNQRLTSAFGPYKELAIKLVASKTYPRGSRLVESATQGVYDLWTSGVGNWQLINAYDCTTDASGNITQTDIAGQVGGDEHQDFAANTTGLYMGTFYQTDLPGFVAADLAGAPPGTRLLSGVIANGTGVIYLP